MTSVPRWLKALLACLMVSLIGGGGWFYRAEGERLRRQAEDELSSIATLKAGQIAAWRSERLTDAASLAEMPLLLDALDRWLAAPTPALYDGLRAQLSAVQRQDRYANVLLADGDGRILLATAGHEALLPVPLRQTLSQARRDNRACLSDLYADGVGAGVQLAAVAPLWARSGATRRLLGAIVLVADAKTFLYPLVESWPLPSRSAETLLVRRDGDSVLFLNELRHQPAAALNLRIPLSRTDVPAVRAVLGTQGVFGGRDYRGVPVVSVLRPVADSPWHMVAKVDMAEVFAVGRHTAALILFSLLAGVLLLAAIALLLWQGSRKAFWRALYQSEAGQRASEARYGITLQGIGDAVIATDGQGCVDLMNPVAAALTGWSQAEARGRPLAEVFRIVNEESRAEVESPVEKVLREGVVVNLANHTLLLARDGSERPIADSGAPIRDEEGRISGVVLVFRDQTAERAAQEAVRIESANARAVMTSSPVALVVLNGAGEITDANPAAVRLFGRGPGELAHRGVGELLGCVNRAAAPAGCGHTAHCRACVFLDAIQTVLATGSGVLHREMEGLFETLGQPAQRWLHFSIEPATLHGSPHLIAAIEDVTEGRRGEAALRQSESTLNEAQRVARIGSYRYDVSLDRWTSSAVMDEIFGIDEDYLRDTSGWLALVHPDDHDSMAEHLRDHVLGGKRPFDHEYRIVRHNDGERRWVHGRGQLQLDGDGRPRYMLGSIQDITERRLQAEAHEALEEQLRQSQRIESVGRLAGGVAHDFNNMLGVIIGHADLAMCALDPTSEVHEDLHQIRLAADRSADLTRQLLAFARQQPAAPRVLNLNEKVGGTLRMLARLIGEEIAVAWLPGEGLGAVKLDPAQLDQILTNLCVNARDAITGVGRITIETHNASVGPSAAARLNGLAEGEYVVLAVGDNGSGMDAEVIARVFEPFYTTKPIGQGTGLGLATVYGIVQQNHGIIAIESAVGAGTTFRVYLPRVADAEVAVATPSDGDPPNGHGETVLLVEDEPATLQMGRRMLEALGYTVLTAGSPSVALELAASHPEVALLLTDVVMPEMHGRELAEHITRLRPGIGCLFMSGYTGDVIAHRGVLDEGVQFLGKPFTRAELAAKVSAALGTAGGATDLPG